MNGPVCAGALVTVSWNEVVWLVAPLAEPVTVTVTVPVEALAFADSVNVLLVCPAGIGVGLNEPVTPVGKPDTARLTAFVKEPVRATVRVTVCVAPRATEIPAPVPVSVKPPTGGGGGFVVPPSLPPPPHPRPKVIAMNAMPLRLMRRETMNAQGCARMTTLRG